MEQLIEEYGIGLVLVLIGVTVLRVLIRIFYMY